MIELETPRLRLRALHRDDLDALASIWLHPVTARHLITRPQSRDDVARLLDTMIEHAKRWGLWAIELKAGGELIGRCGFYPYSSPSGDVEPELAYFLNDVCSGKGLATEAARAALAMLFEHHAPRRAVGLVLPENAASRRVLEKLGMREVEEVEVRGMRVLLYSTSVPG